MCLPECRQTSQLTSGDGVPEVCSMEMCRIKEGTHRLRLWCSR